MNKIQMLVFIFTMTMGSCGREHRDSSDYDLKSIGEPVGTSIHLLEYDDDENNYYLKKCRSFKVVTVNSECNHTEILRVWAYKEFHDLLDAIFIKGYKSFPEELQEPFEKVGKEFVSGEFEKAKHRLTQLIEEKKDLEEFLGFYSDKTGVDYANARLEEVNAEIKKLEGFLTPSQVHFDTLRAIKSGFLEKIQAEKAVYKRDFLSNKLDETQFYIFTRLTTVARTKSLKLDNNEGQFVLMSDSRSNLYLVQTIRKHSKSSGYTYMIAAKQITDSDLADDTLMSSRMDRLYSRTVSSPLKDGIEIAIADGGGLRISSGNQIKYWRTTPQSLGQEVAVLNPDPAFPKIIFEPSGAVAITTSEKFDNYFSILGDVVYRLDKGRVHVSDVLRIDSDYLSKIPFKNSNNLVSTKFLSTLADSDGDGVVDSKDQCPRSRPDEFVALSGSRVGCNNDDDDNDGIYNDEDACSDTPAGAQVWKEGKFIGCAAGQKRDIDLQ